jgi:hypothetical protein
MRLTHWLYCDQSLNIELQAALMAMELNRCNNFAPWIVDEIEPVDAID